MRKIFEPQLTLWTTHISQIYIPQNSRDQLPPILAALQWVFGHSELRSEIFEHLNSRVLQGKQATGRCGMALWHILVLGVVRLALDCDYDRLQYLVLNDILLRQILMLEPYDPKLKKNYEEGFHRKTINQNLHYFDEELLGKINESLVKAGHECFRKKPDEKIEAKADTYVLETNVHFPTDINLLVDAARKCVEGLEKLQQKLDLPGWRKASYWKKKIKNMARSLQQICKNGGKNKEERVKKSTQDYLAVARQLELKVASSLDAVQKYCDTVLQIVEYLGIKEYHAYLVKQIDLVERRLIKDETIPHNEKVHSIFEPHTEWINKGKSRPNVELGHKIILCSDQYGLILDYKVMEQPTDNLETLDLAERLLSKYGEESIRSLSFDKGFSQKDDRALLEAYIPEVVMPKKGKKNKAEKEREKQPQFKTLRKRHSAIESDINALEHHGLNRCPDRGLESYKRYVGFGVLSLNLHRIGNNLLNKNRVKKRAA